MSEVKHLEYFKVENFKCFESFEMNDVGQFNLIVGDNNVGKSTVLEALLFDGDVTNSTSRFMHSFIERFDIINAREISNANFDFIKVFSNKKKNNDPLLFNYKFIDNVEEWKYQLLTKKVESLTKDEVELLQKRNLALDPSKTVVIITRNNSEKDANYISNAWQIKNYSPIVFYNVGYSDDIVEMYSTKIQISKGKKEEFLNDISLFVDALEDIELSQNIIPGKTHISIRIKNRDSLIPLSMYGEGTNKLFRILCEIYETRNERLLIDEIDTGVHHSRFKQYWKTILESALKNKVQLFSTTHSLECLKYFKEALGELGEEYQAKSRLFHLAKIKDGSIKAYNYNYSQFSSNIELENEMRG